MQIAFIKTYEIDDSKTITVNLCKDLAGNRPVEAIYITAGTGIEAVTVESPAEVEIKGFNMADLELDSFANDTPIMYIVECFDKVTVTATGDGTLTIKGVY